MITRQEMIAAIEWLAEDTGYGDGGMGLLGALMRYREPELKTVVCPVAPDSNFQDDELKLLYRFATQYTNRYRESFGTTCGANIILIKREGSVRDECFTWMGKRRSWTNPVWHASLPEALGMFAEDLRRDRIGQWVLFDDGSYGEIVRALSYDEEKASGDAYHRFEVKVGDELRSMAAREPVIVAESETDLHHQVVMALRHRINNPWAVLSEITAAEEITPETSISEMWAKRALTYDEKLALARLLERQGVKLDVLEEGRQGHRDHEIGLAQKQNPYLTKDVQSFVMWKRGWDLEENRVERERRDAFERKQITRSDWTGH